MQTIAEITKNLYELVPLHFMYAVIKCMHKSWFCTYITKELPTTTKRVGGRRGAAVTFAHINFWKCVNCTRYEDLL